MSVRLAAAILVTAVAGLAAFAISGKPDAGIRRAAQPTAPIATSAPVKVAAAAKAAAPAPPPQLAPSGIVPSIALEAFLAHDYPAYWRHKAVAVGPKGVFAAAFREPDAAAAIAAARAKCSEKLRWHSNPAHREAACAVVAVNETSALSPDPEAGAAAASVTPARAAITADASAGWTLLRIRDCGPNADAPWHQTWRHFFTANRVPITELALSAPPGAARPCPASEAANDRFLRWNRARLKAALARLASQPKVARNRAVNRVVIWADGRAADVVHATPLRAPLHVITTNAPCTLSMSRHSLLESAVKVSAFVARADAALERAARRRAQPGIEAACAEARVHRPALDVIALPGKPRFPAWQTDVMAKLAAVTDLPPIEPAPDPADRLNVLPFEAHRFFSKTFTLHATHRALVLSTRGRMFVAAGHNRPRDAVQEALYRCRSAAGANGFQTAEQPPCILFAINDDIVYRES